MKNFKNLWSYLIIGFVALFVTACSGGTCSTDGGESGVIHHFPNGAKLFGAKKVAVLQGESSTPQKFVLVGNENLTVNLSTSLDVRSINSISADISCVSLCGEFNPSELTISSTQKESSSVLIVSAGRYLPVGIYNLNLHASYYLNNQYVDSESIGVITVRVEPNPHPFPTPEENGVYISNGTPSVQQGFIFATKPSESNWQQYQSGTTAGITAVANNGSTTLAIHAANSSTESAGFILSNNLNGKFVNYNATSDQIIGNLGNVTVAAGADGYVVLGNLLGGPVNSLVYYISNQGIVTPISSPLTGVQIDTVAYLDNVYYAYSSNNSQIFSSNNGTNWSVVNNASLTVQFSKVVGLANGVYAAISSGGQVYLGSSPINISVEQSLAYNAQQIAVNGNNLAIGEVASNGTGTAYIYQPSTTSLGGVSKQVSISLSTFVPKEYTVKNYAISQLFMTSDTVYAVGGAELYLDLVPLSQLSGVIAGNLVSSLTGVVAITDVKNNSYSQLNAALQNNNLLVANAGVGIQGDLLNNVASPKYPNDGSLTQIKAINYNQVGANSNVSVSYNNLATGNKYAQFMGLAGTSEHFAAVLKNGSVISVFNDVYMSGSTILNDTESIATPDTIAGIGAANYTLVAYANSTNNQVPGSGNIYVSPDNGLSWTSVPLVNMPIANGQGVLVGVTVSTAGNDYLISTFDANNHTITYRSATPAKLATWVAVSNPVTTSLVYLHNQLFAFTSNSTSFSYESTNVWSSAPNALPTAFESATNLATQNIAYGNALYAMVVPNSATTWSQSDIFANLWTQQNVSFYVNGSLFPGKTFPTLNPALVWSGKVWVTIDNASFVYSSTNLTDFYVDLIGNVENAWIVGTPVLF